MTATAVAAAVAAEFEDGLLRRPAELRGLLEALRTKNLAIRDLSVYTVSAAGDRRRVATTDATAAWSSP